MTGPDQKNAVSGGEREAERVALQRKRSIAIGVSLAILAVLFYVATLVKLGGGIAEKAGS